VVLFNSAGLKATLSPSRPPHSHRPPHPSRLQHPPPPPPSLSTAHASCFRCVPATMTAAVDAEPCALVATAADIICSLRGADLAGWTPPWRKPADDDGRERLAWPSVARGKRSRSRRGSSPSAGSGSADATTKKKRARRAARGSPPSPLDYSAVSAASTSGGEDGAFCSPPVVLSSAAGGAGVVPNVEPVTSKVRVLPFLAHPLPAGCGRPVAFPLLRVRAWTGGLDQTAPRG
jgi:hypothetical protein